MLVIGSYMHILLCLVIPIIYIFSTRWKGKRQVLLYLSMCLFLMEISKQIYMLYTHIWNVWYVPFQLCSIPLFYFIFYKTKYETYIQSFMSSFVLIGSICALLYPEGMIHKEWFLTLHSFIWHYILLSMSAISNKGNFKDAIKVFIVCISIATILNVSLDFLGNINLFYIHPFHVTSQPVFHYIGLHYGIWIQNIVYISTLVLSSFIIWKALKK